MGFVLLLLVLRPGPAPEVLRAAQGALAQILGERVEIVMEDAAGPMVGPVLAARQAARHATLTALLEKLPDEALQLSLRREGEAAPLRHTLSFDRADADSERGRALGYAIASMLPPAWIPGPSAESGGARSRAHFSVAVAPEVSWGVGGTSAPYGGRASLAWRFAQVWFAELGGALRFGTMPSAAATFSHTLVAVGMGRVLREPVDNRGLAVSAHAQIGVVRHVAEHLDDDDSANVRREAWMPGGLVGLEGVWWFSGTAGACLAADLEVDAGSVDVYLRDARRETLTSVSTLMSLGLRIRF